MTADGADTDVAFEYYHGFDEKRFEAVLSNEPSDEIMVTVVVDGPTAYPIGAYVSLFASRQDAIAETATGIQDYALEYTHGDLLPPCPDHRHPLHPAVVDGVASWVCPQDREHHLEPIMPVPTEV